MSPRKLAALLLFVSVHAGCGPRPPVLAPVKGTVKIEGQTGSKGSVNFESVDKGFAAAGVLQPDGSYEVKSQHGDGLPLGKYKVSIAPPPGDQPKSGVRTKPEVSLIPDKYRLATTSELVVDVQKGAGPFDFDLKK